MFQTPVRIVWRFVGGVCYISTSVRKKDFERKIEMTAAAITITSGDIRLTRRGRLFATFAAVLFLLAGVFALATSGAEASNTTNSAPAIEFIVSPGDTLWSIAKAVSPAADPRITIFEIKAMNLIEGNSVYPGQIITVPAQ